MAFCGLSVASSITVAFLVSARNLLSRIALLQGQRQFGTLEIVGLHGR